MKRTFQQLVATLLVVGVPAFSQPNRLTEVERDEGYVLLFDGDSLDGWEGDPDLWSVRDGAIVGSSDSHPVDANTFLIHRKSFDDFVLKLEIRLRNGNSGIQFRSEPVLGPGWIVRGYQADGHAGRRLAAGERCRAPPGMESL